MSYTIAADELRNWSAALLEAGGFPQAAAHLIAESLVEANLRGVDSHGVQLLPHYLDQVARGDMDARAEGRVAVSSGGCMTFDGMNGPGQTIADACCRHAVALARAHGLGMVAARNANHFGAAAFWASRIAAEGMIALLMCNASPIVAPWQGRAARLGTNPLCMAVPGPWLLDMATTTVANNRIFKALANGEETIPAGWAMDADGRPTCNTQAAARGFPMPLGGYKGSGLAMLVEILCAALSRGAMSTEVGGIRIAGRPTQISHSYLAIDVNRFMPAEEFARRMEWLVARVKSSPPAEGFEEVLVAGEPESRTEEQRRRDGIPLGAGTAKALEQAAARLGVDALRFEN